MLNKSLTIIIPTFNESKRIICTLNNIDDFISSISNSKLLHVIIVDDGSLDNTGDLINDWLQKVSRNKNCFQLVRYAPNRGKGYAVREGFLRTNTEFVLYTDADGASPIQEVERLLSYVNNGSDIICGSRILKDKNTSVKMSITRRLVGVIFHTILRFLGLADLRDTQCGFKLFKTPVAKALAQNQQCFNYSFDVEYLFLAKKFGYKIKEVPVNWYHVEGSKVNLFKDSTKMLLEVLKIRFVYKYNYKEVRG